MTSNNVEKMARLPIDTLDQCREDRVLRKRVGFGGVPSSEVSKVFRREFVRQQSRTELRGKGR